MSSLRRRDGSASRSPLNVKSTDLYNIVNGQVAPTKVNIQEAYGNNRDDNGAMGNGVGLLEHRRNEEIWEEVKVEQRAMVLRKRRLEWFGHVKRDETENSRAFVEMKMEGKRPRGRPKLRWKDTVRRDMKAWSIREEWATDRERWKSLCKTRYHAQGDGVER